MRSVTGHTLKGSRRCRVNGSSVSLLWEMSRRRRFSRLPARIENPVHQSVPHMTQNPILQQNRIECPPTAGVLYSDAQQSAGAHLSRRGGSTSRWRGSRGSRGPCTCRSTPGVSPARSAPAPASANCTKIRQQRGTITSRPTILTHQRYLEMAASPPLGTTHAESKATQLRPSRPAGTGYTSTRSDPTIASRRASVGPSRACHIRGEVTDPVVQLDDPIVVQVQLLETSQRPELVRDSVELVVAARTECTIRN
jgi:hypothetical protein